VLHYAHAQCGDCLDASCCRRYGLRGDTLAVVTGVLMPHQDALQRAREEVTTHEFIIVVVIIMLLLLLLRHLILLSMSHSYLRYAPVGTLCFDRCLCLLCVRHVFLAVASPPFRSLNTVYVCNAMPAGSQGGWAREQ